jgi:hypothetical protein
MGALHWLSNLKTIPPGTAFQNLGPKSHQHHGNEWPLAAFTWRAIVNIRSAVRFMGRSDAYRANALDCAKLAEVINNLQARTMLLSMAEAWLRLADYVDRREQDKLFEGLRPDGRSDEDASLK